MFQPFRPSILGHALHEKGLQRQKKRRSIGQPPGTKSGRRPADKPRIIAYQTPVVFFDSFYIGFCLFVLPKGRPGRVSSVPWKSKSTIVLWAHRPASLRPAPSCPDPPCLATPGSASPRRPAVPCSEPPHPRYVQVWGSTNCFNKRLI